MSSELGSGRLRPRIDDESRPFWEACARHELAVQGCTNCGRLRFPPRPMCPHCRSFEQAWRPVSGRGTIWSVAIPHAPLLPAYTDLAPYNVIVVTLAEHRHLRMVGNLVAGADADINSIDPHTIEIDEPVRVVFNTSSDGFTLPQWVRAETLAKEEAAAIT